MAYDKKPEDLLEIKVHDHDIYPSLTGLCAGFESGEWRCDAFSRHMMEWLPEFALTFSEFDNLRGHNAFELLRNAAKVVYSTEKCRRRGGIWRIVASHINATSFQYITCHKQNILQIIKQ